jgi:hypothetical protein
MNVSPATPQSSTTSARVTPALTVVAQPDPTPQLHQSHQRHLVGVESSNFEATAELVLQRHDLADGCADTNNRALENALAALESGDVPLARQHIHTAIAAEEDEDAAIRRAERRRQAAHGYARETAKGLEMVLTGRGR